MKTSIRFHTLLCTIALASLCVAGAQEVKPLAKVASQTIQPQWTYKFANAINFQDGSQTAWSAVQYNYMVDALGNAAVMIADNNGYPMAAFSVLPY
jgi:hypothetical protein